jgi:hypothetical protein
MNNIQKRSVITMAEDAVAEIIEAMTPKKKRLFGNYFNIQGQKGGHISQEAYEHRHTTKVQAREEIQQAQDNNDEGLQESGYLDSEVRPFINDDSDDNEESDEDYLPPNKAPEVHATPLIDTVLKSI